MLTFFCLHFMRLYCYYISLFTINYCLHHINWKIFGLIMALNHIGIYYSFLRVKSNDTSGISALLFHALEILNCKSFILTLLIIWSETSAYNISNLKKLLFPTGTPWNCTRGWNYIVYWLRWRRNFEWSENIDGNASVNRAS